MKLTILAATGGIGPNILDESLSGQAGRVRIVTAADLTAGTRPCPRPRSKAPTPSCPDSDRATRGPKRESSQRSYCL